MYLKCIEIQGFKSFANKITFDFSNGITGIVGPNGSGKSNVADAVRWVLGEQSAKQLRGTKMEDVIFAGTEARKAVGLAYVSITLDNGDKALPVEYEEVVVTRKVYRSGESEYLLNGHICRLKDINELFYDTGIGKEGYSIIGQGQIDKILSGKPEERRELFDEAAGIVKYKRRKETTCKKLENERANLLRVNDIITELEKQVEPLYRQSEKARQYLKLKDQLKENEVQSFLIEAKGIKKALAELEDKLVISERDLELAKNSYESTKKEFDEAEKALAQINQEIEKKSQTLNDLELEKGRQEGNINVLSEQINTIQVNDSHYSQRIAALKEEIIKREDQLEELQKTKVQLTGEMDAVKQKERESSKDYQEILRSIQEYTKQIEECKNDMFEILNQKSSVKSRSQRYQTLLEQINIKKAEINSRIIRSKSDEAAQDEISSDYRNQLQTLNNEIDELQTQIKDGVQKSADEKRNIADMERAIEQQQQQYHRTRSHLEALKNMTERYDGYGNSIRKVMEQKTSNKGIIGVIADIVKVEKKYETAIETALGGAIQNIVTDNENTAKAMIQYLKQNKYGRATFLPLSSVSYRNTLENDACINEKGVIGVASGLIKVSPEFQKLLKYLLGRVLVVDHIDNAILIARKYKHSLRIVTLEGEQLNPGGAMTGGAFKNAGNLLGRRREIEELETGLAKITGDLEDNKNKFREVKTHLEVLNNEIETKNKALREKQLRKNTIELNNKQALEKKQEIMALLSEYQKEISEIGSQNQEIRESLSQIQQDTDKLDLENKKNEEKISQLTTQLETLKQREELYSSSSSDIKIQYSELSQKSAFLEENRKRITSEIEDYQRQVEELQEKAKQTAADITQKNEEITKIKNSIIIIKQEIDQETRQTSELKEKRNRQSVQNKNFIEKNEKFRERISDLDKECYRLHAQKEKLEEMYDTLIGYMWSEYELTYNGALELIKEDLTKESSSEEMKALIHEIKNAIKELGNVNVNAIEEYKEVSVRYEFLKQQQKDLTDAETTLMNIIDELDKGMRTQFQTKFNEIKEEFDKVFKELFGGGRGTIELVTGQDILDAGITIISQPPGKKLQNMMQLSGGEKALTAISLLFAIQNLKPSPFCLLDEIEAALDDSNVDRYANYLHKLTKYTQFIVITHRRGTMAAADRLFGITMQEKGVSALVSVDLIEDKLDEEKAEV